MPAQIFGAQAAVTALNRAFANTSPGNGVFSNQVANATASLPAGSDSTQALSYTGFAKTFGAAYASQSASALSTLMLTNMGLLPNAALTTALTEYITSVGTGNVGIVALQLSTILSGLEGDTTYGAAATAWNNEVTTAFTYSSNTANANSSSGDAAANAGQTFTLTKNLDNINGSNGNDTISGSVIGGGGGESTLTVGDSILGGAGDDTLLVSLSGQRVNNANTSVVSTTLADVEKVSVTSFETDNGTGVKAVFDASLWSGVKTVGLAATAATGDVDFTNLKAVADAEMKNGAGDLSVGYASSVTLTGSADVQKLALSGQTAGTFTVTEGFETLEIASAGSKNTITLAAANKHTTVKASGDQALVLDINDTNNTVKTIDASALTGALTLTGLGTTDVTITGGSGNDTVTAANITSADKIDGGTGANTLKTAASLTAANAKNITNFQTLEVTSNVAQAANAIAGVTTVVSSNSTNGTVTFSSMGATTALSITGGNDTSDNVTATLATNTAADSINATVGAASATATTGVTLGTVTLNEYETINLKSSGGTTAATNSINALTSTSATSLTVTGDRALTITAFTSSANLKTLDASAFTGKLNMGAALAATNVTITGGSANDTIVGGSGNDSLTGGDGIDSITSGAGNDTISGGNGNDVIDATGNLAASKANITLGAGDDVISITYAGLTADDTIAGGDGTDTLRFASLANGDNVNLTGANAALLSNVTSMEVISLDMAAVNNGAHTATLTIDDASVVAAGGTLTVKATNAGNAGDTTAVNANGVVLNSSKVVVDFSTITNIGSVTIGNSTDNVAMSAQNDTVTVATSGYLSANDTLAGGAGTDTLKFTDTNGGTYTAATLANVSGFETISVNTGGAGDFKFTLADSVASANNASGTVTLTRNAADTGKLTVDGSAVTALYSLAVTGGTGADTITGGAGNDVITGGAGLDVITVSSGGVDTVVFNAVPADNTSADSITGFITRGTGTTAATGADIIRVIETLGTAGNFNTNVATGVIAALEAADYNEAAGGSANFASNKVNVITDVGYASALAALQANGGANSEKGLLVFYNIGSQRAEIREVTADANFATNGLAADKLIGYFTDITLAGVAGFDVTNFAQVGA